MTKTTAGVNHGRRPVLVGVDGSVSAQAALAWAAAEASYRRCPLRIVHTFTWPMIGDPFGLNLAEPMNDGLRTAAGWILGEAENQARHAAPDIKVTAALFAAGAVPTLLSQAQDADLVVVGSRGIGGFRGLLVGSVSSTVAAHAPCPVVVVHPHRDGTAFPASPTGRIVVGVDGSDVSAAAIRFAFQEAARRRVGVTAVHAAMPTRQHPSLRVPADIVEQVERQLFAEAMDSKRILVSGIDVKTKLVHSHPVQALLDEADGAELLVVGSHGRGGFTGMLLGSVSQAVLHHAPCPVAVVHRTKAKKPSPARPRMLQIAAPGHFADLKELS
ncbi:nucleotide-binding universal stress UspA family protein [Kribbella voronezhensis]|uniref:Nucleotide-binding universal stress UspA family protein n=1 Tax=Kribbella voronezhensis TaxID=2512212 RepID=A0A4R7T939_9ACTN|nr:universal stress protein [Kribbella voronezhensis]TDU87866.1 nucleotide-binding universal stress UspA family protein [Kribbella voronezhensis]